MNVAVWLILCVIWGTTWIFIKFGLEAGIPPFTFASARFLVAITGLVAIVALGRIPMPKGYRQWKLIAITGFLQFTVNYSLVFWSEQYITSGLAAVLQSMISVFGLALAWFYLPDERIDGLKVLAILIGVAGVAIVFYEQLVLENPMAFFGSVAIVIGAWAAAHASILVKARATGISPASLVLGQMVCGLLPMLMLASREGNPLDISWTPMAVFSIFYLAVPGTIGAFWLYYWLLGRIESTKAMMISLVTPIIAVVVGFVYGGEEMPPTIMFGGVMILIGIGLILFRRRAALQPALDTTL
jgi:drug/metabolite transporter (DMT)-like permease